MQQIADNLFVYADTCQVCIIKNGPDAVLVDFGDGAVLDQLPALGVERVSAVLMTHHHRDQGQGLAKATRAGAVVAVPFMEQDLFASVDAHWQQRNLYHNYNSRDQLVLLESGRHESQAFYDECDRRGIMVWQEFVQSSAVLPEARRWPATRDNPSWFHTASWWIKEPAIEEVFGAYPRERASFIHVTQYLQASALQYALEANRRRWPRCAGSLPWQFNEPFPNGFGTAAVDYFGEPKPAYYAVKRAYGPVQVTAKFARQSWSGRDALEAEVWALGAGQGWTVSAEVVACQWGDVAGESRWITADAMNARQITVP